MAKKSFPLSKVYSLLEPGPVVMVTTTSGGRPNIMTMSWHTMIEFEPPLVGCVISSRNHSFGLLKATNECVINIPTVEIAEKVVGCGNSSGANIDKFETFCLTPKTAARVGVKWYSYSGHLEKCVIRIKLLEVQNDNEEKELLETI